MGGLDGVPGSDGDLCDLAGRTGAYLNGSGASISMGALPSMTSGTQPRTHFGLGLPVQRPRRLNSNAFGFYNTSNGNYSAMLYFDNNGPGPVLTSHYNDSNAMEGTSDAFRQAGRCSRPPGTAATAATIYLNGQNLGSLGIGGGQNVVNNFGIDVGRSGFNGYVSDVGVFNHVLTDAQIASLYSGGISALRRINLLPTTTALTVSSGGTLDLSGGSQQVVSLAGSGTVTNSSNGLSVLSLVATAPIPATKFSGKIQDGLGGGTTALVIGSNVTLILAGTDNYTGGTTVATGGTLILASTGAIYDGTSLTVGAGGTLIFDPTAASGSPVMAGAVSPVPEPGTLALMTAGLVVGLGVWLRRRK